MERYEQILLKYDGIPEDKEVQDKIDEIEKLAGYPLPADYKDFLLRFPGFEGMLGEEYVVLWPADEIIDANKGYEITDHLPDTIGIGSNGAGEFIAIEFTDKSTHRIVLSPYIDLDKEYHIEIGDSFADFLIRLDQGKTWFDE